MTNDMKKTRLALSDIKRSLSNMCRDMRLDADGLAKLTGIDPSDIATYWTGSADIPLGHYLSICSVLGIDPAVPMHDDDPAENAENQDEDRAFSCRFCRPSNDLKGLDCWRTDGPAATTKEKCAACQDFQSRYIQYPVTINGLDIKPIDLNESLRKQGSLVAIRPCGEKYAGQTFLGIYLGELPWTISASRDRRTGIMNVFGVPNPAIYVFKLRKIILGCESWWHIIESPDDLSEITDTDIDNTWYVRLMKDMTAGQKGETNGR